jgi:Flp pilus assembly protein TadD
VLGQLKFRQEKYDDALDALSRAAKMDPQDAQIQNYLGITLSQKGMRGPAETALRKAIQLDPDNASAHHNLAVVYLTQKPPLVELARWHYQKAVTAGHPRNPEMEKVFKGQQTTTTKL